MANKKYELDTPSNQSLSKLIDQDLQKESELLQNLIKEVVEANQKVKASHKKRLDDANDKLNILNQEIKRLRQDINKKDEQTTMAQFNHLLKSKDRIHTALRTMRLHPLNSELKKDYALSVHSLKEKLFTHIEERAHIEKAPASFMDVFQTSTQTFIESVFEKTEHTFKGKETLKSIKENEDTFKAAAETFIDHLETEKTNLMNALASRAHILSDGSETTSLKSRVENTYKEKTDALKRREETLKKDLEKDLSELDEKIKTLREDAEKSLREKYKDVLEEQHKDKETLEKELKDLKLDIIRAEKTGDSEALKDLLKTYNKKASQEKGLSESKLQDKVEKKIHKEQKHLIKEKLEREKKYAKEASALELEKNQIDLQFNDSEELFKVQDDYDALKKDRKLNETLESVLLKTTEAYESLLKDALSFASTLETLMFDTKITYLEAMSDAARKLSKLKTDYKHSQIELGTAYKKVALKQSKAQKHIQSVIRRHTLNMHFHNEEKKVNKALTVATRQADIEKTYQQENAKNELIYQQGLIELADKEYELQLLKIRSLYDNEMLLTKAQSERLNVGASVNESMISTTLESQMHFARQQIKYAENEYQVRLENIEAALNREIEYAREKLNQRKQTYRSDIHELKNERDRKLSDLAYRQALFTDPKDKRKLKEQESAITTSYNEKIEAIEEAERSDQTVIRYESQIEGAKNRAQKAKEDANELKEKTIKTFKDMLEQTDQKLDAFKASSGNEKLLGNTIEDEASKTAEKRYSEAIEEANELYKQKVNEPKEKIKELKDILESIEFDETTQKTIDGKKDALKAIRNKVTTALDKERSQLDESLKAIDDSVDALEEKASTLKEKISHSGEDSSVKETASYAFSTLDSMKKKHKSSDYDTLEKSFKTKMNTHKDALRKTRKAMDDALLPALKAYEKFLRKVSVSQNKTFKQLKKQKQDRLKDTLKDIESRYQNHL
ncbi:MAG: hypothetical protein ACQEQA_02950 [Bacillota bacterium]